MNLLSTTLLLLLLLFSPTAVVVKHAAAQSADDQFLAAREAARAGDRARLERLVPALHGYELEPYVDYWRLSLRLDVPASDDGPAEEPERTMPDGCSPPPTDTA